MLTLNDEEAPESARIDAATQLVGLQPTEEVTGSILDLIGPQASPEFSAGLVSALGSISSDYVGSQILAKVPEFTPQARQTAVNMLLERPSTTSALLDGLEDRNLQIADLKLDQRQSLTNHPDRDIRDRWMRILEASGGLPSPDRQQVIQDMLAITQQKGDVTNGLKVFEKQCSKCHVHGKIGQQIGPNLTGMSVHPKEELLVHILDPSRSVEGNFRQYTVATADGKVINGMLAAESKTAIEIIDTEAKRHTIARSDIEVYTAQQN